MERILTNNYRLVDKDYHEYLSMGTNAMEHISFNQPYRRLWARSINDYADIYNNFDVALAPLEDNPFNRCKSELKLIEAGVMGKAIIASNVGPYADVIEHGVDGFLVNPRRQIDWYVFMKRYTENPDLIKEHANNLTNKIKKLFDIEKITNKRKEIYENWSRGNNI